VELAQARPNNTLLSNENDGQLSVSMLIGKTTSLLPITTGIRLFGALQYIMYSRTTYFGHVHPTPSSVQIWTSAQLEGIQ